MRAISQETLWEGILLGDSTAKQLWEVGSHAAKDGKYGIATSLMILSAEESIKAMGLLAHALTGKPDDDFVRPLFSSHRAKHNAAKAIMFIVRIMEVMVENIHEVQEDQAIPEEKKPSVFFERMAKRANDNVNGSAKDFHDLQFWQHTANELKNRGFYVDWCQGKWRTPASIDEATYQDSQKRAEKFIQVMQAIIDQGGIAQIRERMVHSGKAMGN